MTSQVNMREFCDTISNDYAKFLKNKTKGMEFNLIIKYAKKKGKTLDLCCGTGRYLIPLTKQGYNIEGIDFSKGMIREAKAFAKKENIKIKINDGDATSIKKKNATYDTILLLGDSLGSIPGKENRQKTLMECYRILKRRGILICTVGNRNTNLRFFLQHLKQYVSNLSNSNFIYGDRIYDFLCSKGIHHDYSKNEIEESLRKSNFKINKIIKGKADLNYKLIYICSKN
ncbi:class I SAM-dependent methyltransferase [Candidatus Pacearchaeota archaeon]|nr:class I SAM-dependent methyltransferase [Candidatus Pacearchaeota archaeon]